MDSSLNWLDSRQTLVDFGGLGCTWVTLGGLWVDCDRLELTRVNLGGPSWTLGSFRETLSRFGWTLGRLGWTWVNLNKQE